MEERVTVTVNGVDGKPAYDVTRFWSEQDDMFKVSVRQRRFKASAVNLAEFTLAVNRLHPEHVPGSVDVVVHRDEPSPTQSGDG